MTVTIGNDIRVTNPSENVTNWVKEHLIIPNPEYAKKLRMGFYIGKTPKDVRLYEKDGDDLVLPFGTLREILSISDNAEIVLTFSDKAEQIDYRANIPLYDYQTEAVNAMYDNTYGIMQSPTGSGKTQMAIALIAKYGRRALWLTHTADLLKQSYDRAAQYIDESLLGTITGGEVDIGKGVTFATVQTMMNIDLSKYKDTWDVIVVDECHRACGSPTSVMMFYKVLSSLRARHKFGVTATAHRSDGMIAATYALLGQVVYRVPDEAVAGKIMRVGILPVYTGTILPYWALNTDGTYNPCKATDYLTCDEERNERIVQCLVDEKEHSCLILSSRLDHLRELMKKLPNDMKEQAVMVSGGMTSKKDKAAREQALYDMRTGDKRYLFATFTLAKEGLDIPRLDRLFMTVPQGDEAVVIQSIGRIARTCEGKEAPVAYDFVDNFPFAVNKFKMRKRHYKKAGAYLIND